MKSTDVRKLSALTGRSRKGAWIEMDLLLFFFYVSGNVAPARERGLKFEGFFQWCRAFRRSRKGAWIEIQKAAARSVEEAVAPARERGLKYPDTAAHF